jgi:hypothetical protein
METGAGAVGLTSCNDWGKAPSPSTEWSCDLRRKNIFRQTSLQALDKTKNRRNFSAFFRIFSAFFRTFSASLKATFGDFLRILARKTAARPRKAHGPASSPIIMLPLRKPQD